jgi:hypothetical protein
MPLKKLTFNIDKEIAVAGNIKDKKNRNSILCGLNKIRDCL